MTVLADPVPGTGDPGATTPVLDRESARAFVLRHVAPGAAEFERAAAVPESVLQQMSAAGLWAPFLPAAVGGAGLPMTAVGEIHEEVGRGCSSVRSLLTVHSMLSWTVARWGSDEQKSRWLPDLAAGTLLGAFCLSEPDAGSDATGIRTTATPDGTGWRLDGTKTWITGGMRADLLLVFARLGAGIGAFLVSADAPGVRRRPLPEVMGTRGSMIAEITFTDVALGADALLGPSGFTAGMVLTGTLDIGRFSVACGSVGIIQACLDASAAHAARRRVGGVLVKDLQLVQAKLTDMVTDVRAARLLCQEAGRLKDLGDSSTLMATWVAKYFASTAAARHASEAVQIHGALGMTDRTPVARLYRDAKVMEIIEGSNEVQRTTIAAEAFRAADLPAAGS
ncbi:acyl-CoA dehydrogenase [Nakamurella sp. YIM 132087]|uniref:Acyl-CoA dehydrogenase n=1 Tax=Nakamurella alba TaxID=2665158 RepID=A0A7K1FMN7_9ACTN|nr:acyl-CoA dehydrogenase family protein [Nakamurella alba]MTD15350.1 acyl-CoA dehydrogenase [Nakamurella alba]